MHSTIINRITVAVSKNQSWTLDALYRQVTFERRKMYSSIICSNAEKLVNTTFVPYSDGEICYTFDSTKFECVA